MVLTLSEITNIITTNPNKGLIAAGRKRNKELRMHLHGADLAKHLKIIPGHERKHLHELRVEYSRSNVDLFDRLGRPVDKVFSAKGGSMYYNLSREQERQARILASEISDGYSVKDWMENFWTPHYQDDPCGVLLLEIMPELQARLAISKGESIVYPTYQSITCIHDYLPKGVYLEYISIELTEAEKASYGIKSGLQGFRLIDDAYDYIISRDGDSISIHAEYTLINLFGYVPAMINSDIVDPELRNSFKSIYSPIVELADEFLMKGSIKITSDLRHGFPKYVEFADDCPKCFGTGVLSAGDCTECKGSGKNPQVTVSSVKLLKWPNDKDIPVILPKDTGGYVEPSKTYHEIAISDMTMLENYMSLTLWGVASKVQTTGMSMDAGGQVKTATQEMNEIKPQADRLFHISKSAEKRDKFIRDGMIRIQIMPTYAGCSSTYGRRYMLEGPDALWLRYSDAKAKGVAISALDDLLTEYYEAKFDTDPIKLAMQLKLMKVEPFVHYKPDEVQRYRVDPNDYKAKVYYGEWLKEQTDALILVSEASELRESLKAYVAGKTLEAAPEPVV
jgi:hypothetical protein